MGVPKRKRSRPRRDKRFANKGLKPKAITLCSNKSCNEPLSTHAACNACGFYKGAKVLTTKADRAVKRGQANQAKMQRQAKAQPTQEQA
jgi:large subunit ribosomal protein L32